MPPLAFTLLTLLCTAALVGHMLWLGALGDPSAPALPAEEVRKHLVFGSFYLNPADPRGWVQKLNGIGYTVNMRAMKHVYLFVALLFATFGSAIGLCVSVVLARGAA